MTISKMDVAEFVSSSAGYTRSTISRAAGNTTLSKTEQTKLPADLQDDVQFFRDHVLEKGRTVRVADFCSWRETMVNAAVAYADKNGDGKIDLANEGKRVLDIFRDNVANYVQFVSQPEQVAFDAIETALTKAIDGAIIESPDQASIRMFSPALGANPTNTDVLAACFGTSAGSTSVDRSSSALGGFIDMVGNEDGGESAATQAAVLAVFQSAGLSAPIAATESSSQTSIGSGADFCLMARHDATGNWIGIRGTGVWS